jgi:hypothetical protein
MELTAHNQISIERLKKLGYEGKDNQLRFKFIHISHGWGHLRAEFELAPCL